MTLAKGQIAFATLAMRAFEKVVNFPQPFVVALQKAQKQAQTTCQDRRRGGTMALRKPADKRVLVRD